METCNIFYRFPLRLNFLKFYEPLGEYLLLERMHFYF